MLAGTIVKQGTFRFKAEEVGRKTMLAHIIRMVQEAQGSKAPVQRLVDRIALIFVPAVVAISLLTFAVWLLIGGTALLPQALLSAVSVLVIACPCAMGLATPTALMVGIGKAAEKNILIKDATALEEIRKVDAMVIDKTGTLTEPNKRVCSSRASRCGCAQATKTRLPATGQRRPASPTTVHRCCHRIRKTSCDTYRARAIMWRWWATASTTRRHSLPLMSASRWAKAPT